MDQGRLENFLHWMGEAVLEAGELAKEMQGKVANIGKKVDQSKEGTKRISARAEAKTIVDEEVQEILLKAAADCLDRTSVSIDGEEDTPSLLLFPRKKSDITLVLDPIDGTLDYLNGKDRYNIVACVVEKGNVVAALVYFPARDMLYFIDPDGTPRMAEKFSKTGLQAAKKMTSIGTTRLCAYVNYQVSQRVIHELQKKGYEVVRDIDSPISWMDAFLLLASGKIAITIFENPQIRDIVLGAIVTGTKDGYAVDWQGKPLVWPAGGRVPEALFGIGKIDQRILQALAGNR